MKDILTIIFRLTLTCIVAGLIMGGCFILTSKAKQHNEHVNEQRVMLSLLGYAPAKPAPASLKLHPVYRYLVTDKEVMTLGYLVPVGGAEPDAFTFVSLDLDGKFLGRKDLKISSDKVAQAKDRQQAIQTVLGSAPDLRYADQTVIVTDGGKRQAYLLPGEFPGFKTFIKVMLALDDQFTILGMEIMEHEEDPGLGAEITQDYFKNQFKGKQFEALRNIDVVKVPLPDEYRAALEADKTGRLGPEEVSRMQENYKDKNIYALTGATISSRSVTNGVKGIVKKFAYRIAILDRVLAEQHIVVPF